MFASFFRLASLLKSLDDDWVLLDPNHGLLDDSFFDDLASELKILFASLLSYFLKLLLAILDIVV